MEVGGNIQMLVPPKVRTETDTLIGKIYKKCIYYSFIVLFIYLWMFERRLMVKIDQVMKSDAVEVSEKKDLNRSTWFQAMLNILFNKIGM